MNVTARHHTGTALAALPTVDGLAHPYWATDATWPAADERTLSLAVLGTEVPFGPPVVPPPAAITLTGATAVLAHSRGRGCPATRLLTAAAVTPAAGLAVRGLAGLGWATAWAGRPGSSTAPDATPEALIAAFTALRPCAHSGTRRPCTAGYGPSWCARPYGSPGGPPLRGPPNSPTYPGAATRAGRCSRTPRATGRPSWFSAAASQAV
ncbi:hypothetical protein [Streptomyces sp. NPDC002602]|uniref:hypothetical protein n=1 Tax=Streptomyces sp. NPDC002602 TaxID=3364654 RepID=UPI0036920CBD